MNLLPAIEEIKEQIEQIESRHEMELKPYKESLCALQKLNKACPECLGQGEYMRPRACAEDDMTREMIRCHKCNGTGIKKEEPDD